MSRVVSGAAVDRYDSDLQRDRAVFKFLDTTRDKRAEEEEESRNVAATTTDYSLEGEEEEGEYDDEYYDYEDGMSGDYEVELPQGEFFTQRLNFFNNAINEDN